jgi:hypothetical protein
MRKMLSPLVWSTSFNEALCRPPLGNYKSGYIGILSSPGLQQFNINDLMEQFQFQS